MAMRTGGARVAGSTDRWWPAALLMVAIVGWWRSVQSSHAMTADGGAGMGAATMLLAAFLVAWVAMMAAMMLPAVLPVVRLYTRAASRGTVAPVALFLAGYGAIWSAVGLPAFIAWRRINGPLSDASL